MTPRTPRTQPRGGWRISGTLPQGSSCLATLGWELESRWDSANHAGALDLSDRILASYQTGPGRGLPIGNLTSQHFANFYLAPQDRGVDVMDLRRIRTLVRLGAAMARMFQSGEPFTLPTRACSPT